MMCEKCGQLWGDNTKRRKGKYKGKVVCDTCNEIQEMCRCTKCDKLIPADESFEFDGEQLQPYCENCYEDICIEFNIENCILCGKQFSIGNDGNELGFCLKCQKKPDFPYDLEKYYQDYDNDKVVFKGFDTMSRGILEKYRKMKK